MTGKVSLCPVAPGKFASVRDRRAIAKQTDDVHVAPAVWKSTMLSLTSTPVAAVTRRPRRAVADKSDQFPEWKRSCLLVMSECSDIIE